MLEIIVDLYRFCREWLDLFSAFHLRSASLLCIALVGGLAVVGMSTNSGGWLNLVSAAGAEQPSEISFDIPSQSLNAALDAFGTVSRTQVFYETALAAGRRSNEVKGVYTPEAALRLLLLGTGLDFDYTTARTVALVPASPQVPRAETEPHPDILKFDRFLGGVQAGVMSVLCRHPDARPGGFKVVVRFSINRSGAITNPVLLASTGKLSRDRAISNILTHLSFSEPPPAEMPQPITMVLTATASPRDRDSCADAEME